VKKIKQKLLSITVEIILSLVFMGWHTNVSAVDLHGQTIIMEADEKLKISKCCKDVGKTRFVVVFDKTGWTWTATGLGGDDDYTYSGTYSSNTKGTKFVIEFDDSSKQGLNETLEDWTEELVEELVTITSSKYSFSMKVNSKFQAKVVGKIKLKGSTIERSGSGAYKIVAKGNVLNAPELCDFIEDD